MNSNWRWTAIVIFILLALVAVYFRDVLTGKYLLVERDLAFFFIPPRFLWTELVKNGTFPLWNPYILNGYPLFATLQPGVLHPLSILYFFLPFDLAFNYIIVFHFFLAGLSTFFLLRSLNASYVASLVSAITFMLSGYLLSVHNVLSTLLSVSWVPLVFLLLLHGLRKRSLRFIVFSSLAACAMFLGGGIETVYVTIIMVCLLLFLIPLTTPMEKGQLQGNLTPYFLKLRLSYLGIFIAIFLGVSAIQTIPFMELSAQSVRAGGISYKEAILWSMHPRDLLQFFMPDLYGYKLHPEKYYINQNWLKTIYLGTIPFLLSLFFFIKRDKRVLIAFLLIILCSLILAFGGYTPIYYFIYKCIPFFNKMRYPVKFLFLTTLVITITSGLGYDRLISGIKEKSLSTKRLICGISAFGIFAVIMFACLNFFETPISSFLHQKGFDYPNFNDLAHNINNLERLLCIAAIFGLVVIISFIFKSVGKFLLPVAVLLLLAFDLFFANQGFYLKTLAKTYHGSNSNIEFILSDKSLFRILVTKESLNEAITVAPSKKRKERDHTKLNLEKISTGLGIERHIFDASGSAVMVLKRIRELNNHLTPISALDSTNLLDLMNVKYVISTPQILSRKLKIAKMDIPDMSEFKFDSPTQTNFKKALEQYNLARVKIYQNPDCLSRAFLVKDYKVVPSEEECRNILCSKDFNPSKLLLLDENPSKQYSKEYEQKKIVEKVEMTSYNANSITLQANVAEQKFLFISEAYYPGWKASVDGEKAHIYRANYAFRALSLKPGEHKIEFFYDPWTFKAGLIISIISIMGAIYLLVRYA